MNRNLRDDPRDNIDCSVCHGTGEEVIEENGYEIVGTDKDGIPISTPVRNTKVIPCWKCSRNP